MVDLEAEDPAEEDNLEVSFIRNFGHFVSLSVNVFRMIRIDVLYSVDFNLSHF